MQNQANTTDYDLILDRLDNLLVILSLHTINDEAKCMKMQLQAAFKAAQQCRAEVEQAKQKPKPQ